MYTEPEFKTKKELKQAVAKGARIRILGEAFKKVKDGEAWVEGPNFPKPHRWYAHVIVKDGLVTEVLSE